MIKMPLGSRFYNFAMCPLTFNSAQSRYNKFQDYVETVVFAVCFSIVRPRRTDYPCRRAHLYSLADDDIGPLSKILLR